MTAGNIHRAAGAVAVNGTRPVVLVRYRPRVAGETARIVHVVPAHPGTQTDTAGVALCGALLRPDLVQTVTPGETAGPARPSGLARRLISNAAAGSSGQRLRVDGGLSRRG
ncbi:MAG: hypothetical protein ACRDRF_01940 [Pseudonocardiaceae bacterium]